MLGHTGFFFGTALPEGCPMLGDLPPYLTRLCFYRDDGSTEYYLAIEETILLHPMRESRPQGMVDLEFDPEWRWRLQRGLRWLEQSIELPLDWWTYNT